MLKLGVLISGRGSNLQSLIDATAEEGFPATIACVISNKPEAEGLKRAEKVNILASVINHCDYKDRPSFEAVLDRTLEEAGVQLVCLAGFMRILSPWFVTRWQDRLINIHPSLLPAFPGLDTHKKALEYGAKFAGCTVHFVRAEMDHGPIILQAVVPITAEDTEESLAARVLTVEHKIYPEAVRFIAENRVNVYEERAFVIDTKTMLDVSINPSDTKNLPKQMLAKRASSP